MPNNSMPLVSVKILDHLANGPTRHTSSVGGKDKAPTSAGAKSMVGAQGSTTARHAANSAAPTNFADGRAAIASRRSLPPTAQAAQQTSGADKIEADTQRALRAPTKHRAAAMAQPRGPGVRAGAPEFGRLMSAPRNGSTSTAAASAAGRGRASPTRHSGVTPMQAATQQERAVESDFARVRSRPGQGDYAAPGHLVPAIRPAVPAVPTVLGAAITALGHVETSRRAQGAARSPMQAALRAPIADVAHPEVATANIGVQVGGRPPALGSASAGA